MQREPSRAPKDAPLAEPAAPRAILGFVLRVYQLLHPILAALALVTYGFLSFKLIRTRQIGTTWIVLTGLLIMFTARIALVSLLEATSLRIQPGTYLHEAYPPMLAFVALACLSGAERLARRTAGRH